MFYQSACSPPNDNSLHLFTLSWVTDIICQCKNNVSRILCTKLQCKAARMAQLIEWMGYKLTVTGIDSRQEVLWFATVSIELCGQTHPSHTNVVNLKNYLHVLLWFATRGYISLSCCMPSYCKQLQLLCTVTILHHIKQKLGIDSEINLEFERLITLKIYLRDA
jgi:hypothetical protein